jgi:poly(A) polymerase
MRPALDGNRIMQVLDLAPGPEVGAAYKFLLELRMDEGVLSEDEAVKRLQEWWARR